MITLFHGLSNIGILFPARSFLRARSSVNAQLPARLFFPPVFLLMLHLHAATDALRDFASTTVCGAALVNGGSEPPDSSKPLHSASMDELKQVLPCSLLMMRDGSVGYVAVMWQRVEEWSLVLARTRSASLCTVACTPKLEE